MNEPILATSTKVSQTRRRMKIRKIGLLTLLAILAYNLVARLTGDLTIELEEVRQKASRAVSQERPEATGTAASETEAST